MIQDSILFSQLTEKYGYLRPLINYIQTFHATSYDSLRTNAEKDPLLYDILSHTVLAFDNINLAKNRQRITACYEIVAEDETRFRTHSQVIYYAISLLNGTYGHRTSADHHWSKKNILTFGYNSDTPDMAVLDTHHPHSYGYTNSSIEWFNSTTWNTIRTAIGNCGFLFILLEANVFRPVGEVGTYVQLCGPSFESVVYRHRQNSYNLLQKAPFMVKSKGLFILKRYILYFKPMDVLSRKVAFGLRSLYTLFRPISAPTTSITKVLIFHMFPNECKLGSKPSKKSLLSNKRLPKRLNGKLYDLCEKFKYNHSKCRYTIILDYCCPVREDIDTLGVGSPLLFRTAVNRVVWFCRTIFTEVVPMGLYGTRENFNLILESVEKFIRLEKSECLTISQILDTIKLKQIPWLFVKSNVEKIKISLPELKKARSLLSELTFWLFNYFLVSVIRHHFYVTETTTEVAKLSYFRQDVWVTLISHITEGPRFGPFTKVDQSKIPVLSLSKLGISDFRFIPKKNGFRNIVCSGKTQIRIETFDHNRYAAIREPSTNKRLENLYEVIRFEKARMQNILTPFSPVSSVNSVHHLLRKLSDFKADLQKFNRQQKIIQSPLFFVKVDVEACYDRIPPALAEDLLARMIREEEYCVQNFREARIGKSKNHSKRRKFARPASEKLDALNAFNTEFKFKTNRLVIDQASGNYESRSHLVSLIHDHLFTNLVQIGQNIFQQTEGVPQGSILSTAICNIVYEELERDKLGFLHQPDSSHCTRLFRYIDDFLLITTDKSLAQKFLLNMHHGYAKFGVTINLSKSLVNFSTKIDNKIIPSTCQPNFLRSRRRPGRYFPFVGIHLSTDTLDVIKVLTDQSDPLPGFSHSVSLQHLEDKLVALLRRRMSYDLVSLKSNTLSCVIENFTSVFTNVVWKALVTLKPSRGLVRQRIDLQRVQGLFKHLINTACWILKMSNREYLNSVGNVERDFMIGVFKELGGEIMDNAIRKHRWLGEFSKLL